MTGRSRHLYKPDRVKRKEEMAKAKFISEREREVIRVGLHHGIPQKKIAAALNRSNGAVCQQVQRMREDGTLHDLPLPFMAELIRKGLDQ